MTIEQKSVILAAVGLASRALEIADRAIAACTGNMTASDAAFVQAIEETNGRQTKQGRRFCILCRRAREARRPRNAEYWRNYRQARKEAQSGS